MNTSADLVCGICHWNISRPRLGGRIGPPSPGFTTGCIYTYRAKSLLTASTFSSAVVGLVLVRCASVLCVRVAVEADELRDVPRLLWPLDDLEIDPFWEVGLSEIVWLEQSCDFIAVLGARFNGGDLLEALEPALLCCLDTSLSSSACVDGQWPSEVSRMALGAESLSCSLTFVPAWCFLLAFLVFWLVATFCGASVGTSEFPIVFCNWHENIRSYSCIRTQ